MLSMCAGAALVQPWHVMLTLQLQSCLPLSKSQAAETRTTQDGLAEAAMLSAGLFGVVLETRCFRERFGSVLPISVN